MCLISIPLLEHCARGVGVLNVVAIVYITHTGSNLLNDIIVAYVNVPPHTSFTWTASDDILRGIVPRYRLSSILMSRFLLNLQSVNQKVTGEDFRTTRGGSGDHTESLVFQRVVGSIASSIDVDLSFVGYEFEDDSSRVAGGRNASDYELSPRLKLQNSDEAKSVADAV